MSTTSVDRKLELERKKAKLAQIREEKRRKEEEKTRQFLQSSSASDLRIDNNNGDKSLLVDETEKILSELGISPHAPETPQNEHPPADAHLSVADRAATPQLSRSHETSPASTTVYRTRGRVCLDKSTLTLINLQPKEHVLYSKTTQTMGESGSADKDLYPLHSYEWDDEFMGAGGGRTTSSSAGGTQPSPVDEVRSEKTISDEKQSTVLFLQSVTDEERQKILASVEFHQFFDRTSRILERAITEKDENIFIDYSRTTDQDARDVSADARLSLQRTFFDERWSKGRCVTAMDWNAQHPELLAVAYDHNPEAQNEPSGVVLVWNTKFKKTSPEYVFHCQSRVLSLCWAKFHPNLVLGGTYSGQICLWDNRQNKRTPVQKSPLSAQAHTHPVFCLKVVGTQNAHNLVSVSTDGKLCSWSLDMLAKPLETLDLALKQSKQVAAMCIDFPQNEINNFLLGAEDGCVYLGFRHGQRAGVIEGGLFEAHYGPVTCVACHAAAAGPVDFSHLFLTGSFDWTVKLWSSKESKPLCSFEDNSDYILDVAWSPTHPALFAVSDCKGRLSLWHLNQDIELPAATVLSPDDGVINKLLWLPSGQQIAAGDDLGRVQVYDVNDQLALPKAVEWTQMAKVLHDVRQGQVEAEELVQAMALSAPSSL